MSEARTSTDFHTSKLKYHNQKAKKTGFHIYFPVWRNEYSIIYKKWNSFSKRVWNAPIGMLQR